MTDARGFYNLARKLQAMGDEAYSVGDLETAKEFHTQVVERYSKRSVSLTLAYSLEQLARVEVKLYGEVAAHALWRRAIAIYGSALRQSRRAE